MTVQAQVMCWNEKYNGWLPLDGGGVSSVSLIQRASTHRRACHSRSSVSGPGAGPGAGSATGAVHAKLEERASWSAACASTAPSASQLQSSLRPSHTVNGHGGVLGQPSRLVQPRSRPASTPSPSKYDYLIFGRRVQDKKVPETRSSTYIYCTLSQLHHTYRIYRNERPGQVRLNLELLQLLSTPSQSAALAKLALGVISINTVSSFAT